MKAKTKANFRIGALYRVIKRLILEDEEGNLVTCVEPNGIAMFLGFQRIHGSTKALWQWDETKGYTACEDLRRTRRIHP